VNGPFDQAIRRQQLERFARALQEKRRRQEKALHRTRGHRDADGRWVGGLYAFVKYFWPVLEPGTEFVDGWPLEAVCEHLEAVTFGELRLVLINVFPGAMKSLLVDVFWPAWEWGPMEMPHLRYVAFSYSSSLTERDNGKFRDILISADYKAMYGDHVILRKTGETKITNSKHGSKLATSVGGVGTGERGDRIILDDPHNVKESESDVVREETIRWFRESMSSRMNDIQKSAVVIIMQRVHESDVSGTILTLELPYTHLCIPMRYVWQADENGEPYATDIGWVDPRWTEDPEESDGVLAWPARFPEVDVDQLETTLGDYATAGQLQQTPKPRGGGIIKTEYWQPWEGKFPPFSYVVGSLDGAFTEDERNDACAMTIWGVFENEIGHPRLMMIFAWEKWLAFEGQRFRMEVGENQQEFMARQMKEWGLVEWCEHTASHWKVDHLLIEAKANGISTAQALEKRYRNRRWSIQLIDPKGDKTARTHSVQPVWAQHMVYAPLEKQWAQDVINQMGIFPFGTRDDMHDSATQAVKHIRDLGLLEFDEDIRAAEIAEARLEAVKAKGMGKLKNYMPGSR
jgi:predicted phage terminase large subunit-like protein